MHKYSIKIQYGKILVGKRSGRVKGFFFGAFRRSDHRCRTPWRVRRPRRCRSRASRRPGCRDKWCEVRSPGSAPEWDSPPCRGGRSSRRCRRTDAESPSFPAWTRLRQTCGEKSDEDGLRSDAVEYKSNITHFCCCSCFLPVSPVVAVELGQRELLQFDLQLLVLPLQVHDHAVQEVDLKRDKQDADEKRKRTGSDLMTYVVRSVLTVFTCPSANSFSSLSCSRAPSPADGDQRTG